MNFNKTVTIICSVGVLIHLVEMANGCWANTAWNGILFILSLFGLISGALGMLEERAA